MQKNKITKIKTIEEIREDFKNLSTGYDSRYIFDKANEERDISKTKKGEYSIQGDSFYYKAMTILEFDKGVLLSNAVPNLQAPFALELLQNLQKEFNCQTASEKSLAEVITINFIRILSTQQKIKDYLDLKTINQNGIGYLNVMSKELDRAERHYLTSLETLRTLHSPSFSVNIKTNTAVVGQNQAVQVKNA